MFNRTAHTPRLAVFVVLILTGYSFGIAQDARLIAKTTFPSVVMLEMRDEVNRPMKLGSGFFVRPDVIVTNFHVIEGAAAGSAKIVGNPSIYPIEGVLGINRSNDLVLLKVKGVTGRALVLADISKIEVGQEVFALGNPKGLEGTISPGIVSGNSLRQLKNEYLIQITAPISSGSSGGPVVNRKGEVIGVAVSSLKDGQNLNFAIPASYLALLLANSKNMVSLKEANGIGDQTSISDTGPTLSETAKWITETLSGREGAAGEGFLRHVYRNERIVFDGCTMFLTASMKKTGYGGLYQDNDTFIAPLGKIRSVGPFKDGRVTVYYPTDSLQVTNEQYWNGKLDNSKSRLSGGFLIWVGDPEMGTRVIKAFNRIAELCGAGIKKEAF